MPSSTPRDLASAYLASFTKLASWLAVSALVYRHLGPAPFALLALIRSTLGLLTYTSLGLAPSLIHHLAHKRDTAGSSDKNGDAASFPPPSPLYSTAILTSLLLSLLASLLLILLSSHTSLWLRIPSPYLSSSSHLILTLGLGILARLLSDPPSALLQTHHHITTDNLLLASSDLLWVALFSFQLLNGGTLDQAGSTFLIANLFLLLSRYTASHYLLSPTSFSGPARGARLFSPSLARTLLTYGSLITLAQLADYLYAPTDYLLINHLLSTRDLAAYVPCVQIDAALLLLVTAISTTLFPKAALAHAHNDTATLRRYYIQGTLLSVSLLLIASVTTYLLAPPLLRLYLRTIPPGTLHILPLVLLHTLIGGSSAVSRSILLATGHVKPFTSSVLLAALLNVSSSYLLVRYTHLGLTAIVLGTLLAVTLRCALFLPWYTLHTLRPPPRSTFDVQC